MQIQLQFILASRLRGFDSLHQAQTSSLDGGDLLVLLGGQRRVLILQLLHLRLKLRLGFFQLGLLDLDEFVEFVVGHRLEFGDFGLFGVVAEIDVFGRAHGLKILGEIVEGVEVASALVVLEVGGVAVFDCGISTNTGFVAQRLSGGCTVDVGNELGGGPGKGLHQLVPIWLHFLTVASPRREELDEYRLARRFGVPIIGGQFDGGGRRCGG
jgi:hypothetical protein